MADKQLHVMSLNMSFLEDADAIVSAAIWGCLFMLTSAENSSPLVRQMNFAFCTEALNGVRKLATTIEQLSEQAERLDED